MNDFAKSQLMKYGWTEGKGLGKHESGITEALKPKLKFDTTGVGHKDKDWNNWWESTFNNAASSITVKSETHGVSIFVSKENATDDYLNDYQDLSTEKSKYGNFFKASTLLNGNLVVENNSNICEKQNIEENSSRIPFTDEEIFKICGGRTAHKGARHGLTLNGKLKRIAQQEKQLLNLNSYRSMSTNLQNNNNISESNKYKKINDENIILPETSCESAIVPIIHKTSKKKNKVFINDLSHQLNVLCNVSDNDKKRVHTMSKEELKLEKKEESRKRKRKKEKKYLMSFNVESIEKEKVDDELNGTSFPISQKSWTEIIKKNIQEQVNNHVENKYMDISISTKKKKKKKNKKKKLKKEKNQDIRYKNITSVWEDDELSGSHAKKLKRSHKRDSDVQTSDLLNLIKDEDIKTLECKFQTKLSCNEIPIDSHKVKSSSVRTAKSLLELPDAYFKKKIDYLNSRISKKKHAKLRKKEKSKLTKITESLKAVHFNTEESIEEKNTRKNIKSFI
ncbi:PREDICTED: G patch domain-containing protein 4 [Eufriesea mexicana]|uniref:G patch domain-containing protein 4 n=1 Tax=Eufriesea mexicana TaxID=516756 RepID=UPI00083C64A8|nr:PREDICTED: G patch domain-containing protein 4 [Eufriesea mexicana]